MTIGIQGFYGHGNLGDEAILQGLLTELESIKLKIFTEQPRNVNREYGIKSINTRIYNFPLLVRELKSTELFLLGGGGLLKDWGNTSRPLKKWLSILNIAKNIHIKTGLCAIGVENIRYEKSKKAMKKTLNGVDIITVRDKHSKELLEDIGIYNEIEVVSDPALLLANTSHGKTYDGAGKMKVCISVRHWYDEKFSIKNQQKNTYFIESMKKITNHLIEEYNAEVSFIPFRTINFDDDREIAQKIIDGTKNKKNIKLINEVPKPNEFISIAQDCQIVLGMRLHSLILASSVGTPFIGFGYMPKICAFTDSINQKEYSFDLNQFEYDAVIESIGKTMANYRERSNEIIENVGILKEKTKKAIKYFKECNER